MKESHIRLGRNMGLLLSGILFFATFQNCSMQSPNGSSSSASLESKDIVFHSTPSDLDTYPGAQINVAVDASSTAGLPLNYKWFKNNSELIGQTSNTLSIPSVAKSDQGLYKLVISNSTGQASVQFNLRVGNIPVITITQQPLALTGQLGQAITLSVVAVSSDNQSLKYQWFKDGVALSGSVTPSLMLSNLAATNAGVYKVEVSGAVTEAAKVTSNSVRLTIQNTFNVQSATGCVNGYCSCVTPNQLNVPYRPSALAICVAKGYTDVATFTTVAGPILTNQCNAAGAGCFLNLNVGNIVCSTVTCTK